MPRWRCRLFTELGASTLLCLQSLSPWFAIRSFRHGSEEWRTGRDCVSDASAKPRPISSSGQGGIACAALRPSQDGSRCSQFSDRRHGRLTAFKPIPPLRSGRGSLPSLKRHDPTPASGSGVVADREGFEPSVTLPPHTLSKRAHSTTLTPALGRPETSEGRMTWQPILFAS